MAVGTTVTGIDLMVERKMRGISQSAVAAHMGTSKQYVSNLEGSLTEPVTADAARKYRDALDAAVEEREGSRPTIVTLQPGGDDIPLLNEMDYPAAATWATPTTDTAVKRFVVVPSPNWPSTFQPHAHAVTPTTGTCLII